MVLLSQLKHLRFNWLIYIYLNWPIFIMAENFIELRGYMKILFLKRKIYPEQPINWEGEHLLECTHSFNRRSKKYYLMYCDVLKKMPNARLKIRVYGRLYNSIQGERIRYVDADQVCSADKWNISKNEGEVQ
jgi:hypothetical protein